MSINGGVADHLSSQVPSCVLSSVQVSTTQEEGDWQTADEVASDIASIAPFSGSVSGFVAQERACEPGASRALPQMMPESPSAVMSMVWKILSQVQ